MIDLDAKTLETIQKSLKKFPAVKEAVLFGSRALGTAKKGSDIDLALKGSLDLGAVRKISYELNEEGTLPYFFDIVHYESLNNQALVDHIDQYGKTIFTAV